MSDIYTKKSISADKNVIDYCLFVCFFPQLVAGPIVHHKEMMPQFEDSKSKKINWENIYWGLILLAIGLSKKVLIADMLSSFVKQTFEVVNNLSFMEATVASLAYSFQLYFDFSGYSDMAVACGLFFNIKLPFNFNSPYTAVSIQDFWQKWHITLSRWLKEYVYIPLGGNQHGQIKTLANLFLTFLIGGIWHGAAWTFVAWGFLHGIAIVIHRVWVSQKKSLNNLLAGIITFLFINFTWIIFRAPDFKRVKVFVDGFLLKNTVCFTQAFYKIFDKETIVALVIGAIILLLPQNTKSIYENRKTNLLITTISIFLLTIVIFILLFKYLDPNLPTGDFIYFQF